VSCAVCNCAVEGCRLHACCYFPEGGLLCDECQKPIEPRRPALINGFPLHVDPCFAKRLRRCVFSPHEWSIDVRELSAEEAYQLGKQTVAILGPRRAKKRGVL
jgi:hypothetical protein